MARRLSDDSDTTRRDATSVTNAETVNCGCPTDSYYGTINVAKFDVLDIRSYVGFIAGRVNKRENRGTITLRSYDGAN